jgi:hypothetical protein
MPTSFSLKTMCRYLLQSVRPAAHVPGIVAAGILLAGCSGYCNLLPTALGGMDNQLSPRDQPRVRVAPAITKAALNPQPPKSRVQTRAKAALASSEVGCDIDTECHARLKTLLDDSQRAWILMPPSPSEHATGTRLYAYHALRSKLSCDELALSLREIHATTRKIRGKVPAVASGQIPRVREISTRVETALRAEYAGRCGTN